MQFKTKGNLGIGCGVVTMLFGSLIATQGPESLPFGTAAWMAGWSLVIWGCVNYARWKGLSGWFGLMGYLLLPGLVLLACLPNKRRSMPQTDGSGPAAEADPLVEQDRKSGHRYLLTLLPLGLLCVAAGGFMLVSQANIEPGEWKSVAPPGFGFQALLPGTPKQQQTIQETPAGKVDVLKLIVQPPSKREMYAIVSVRFPDEMSTSLGGAEQLLDIGRSDVLSTWEGQLQSERRISVTGVPGLELEILPPKGAIVKVRVFATDTHVYQVSVHVPKFRLASEDVRRFFDAFKLSPEAPQIAD
jgi:hypothetical protein